MRQPSVHDLQAVHWAMVFRSPDSEFEEIDKALNWVNESEDNRIAMERVQRFLDACDGIAANVVALPDDERADKPLFTRQMLAIAASVLFMALAIPALIFGFSWHDSGAQAELYTTNVRELRTIVLADKSRVTLSGHSAVLVSMGKKERRIELGRGEALFDVARDPSRPFVVHTGRGTATALGTSFNVHREGDGATVTVVHGQVSVSSSGRFSQSRIILTPSMQGHIFRKWHHIVGAACKSRERIGLARRGADILPFASDAGHRRHKSLLARADNNPGSGYWRYSHYRQRQDRQRGRMAPGTGRTAWPIR